jgi:hypothetical protein
MSIYRKTKNAIFIALVVIMMMGLSACGQKKYGPNTDKFLRIMENGNFFAKGTVTEGNESIVMEMYNRGDEGVVIMETEGITIRTIVLSDFTYIINETDRMMIVTTTDEAMSMINMDIKDLKFIGSGTASFNGKLLTYDEYESGSELEGYTADRIYYFVDGGKLAGWRTFLMSGETVDFIVSDFGRNFPKSVFDVPTSGYEIIQ